jgi:hypothetical protein
MSTASCGTRGLSHQDDSSGDGSPPPSCAQSEDRDLHTTRPPSRGTLRSWRMSPLPPRNAGDIALAPRGGRSGRTRRGPAAPGSRLRVTRITPSRNSREYGLGMVNILLAAPLGTTDQMTPDHAAVPPAGGARRPPLPGRRSGRDRWCRLRPPPYRAGLHRRCWILRASNRHLRLLTRAIGAI